MAILLLDRWLQPPPTTLPQYPPSPPDSFVLPATGTTNQSRTAKKYSITRQELEGGGGGGGCCVGGGVVSNGCWLVQSGSGSGGAHRIESPSEIPPVFTPHPILLCSTVTRDEGRWRWRSNRPCLQRNATPLSNFQVRWNNKMPRITYSKSMAPYLGRTKGWVGSRYPVHPPTTRTRERGRRG